MMRGFLLATTGLLALVAAPAFAADMAVKAPPMAAPVFTWTGFYAGLNLGGSWMNNDATYLQPTAGGFGAATMQSSSVLGGGQVGANWQVGMFMLGAEADFDGRHINADTGIAPFGGAARALVNLSQTENWIGTVRGRFGWATGAQGRILIYGTGGVAYGDIQHSYLQFAATGQSLGASSSTTSTGWTPGLGLEFAVWNNLTVGIEYLHYDLGNTSLGIPVATAVGGVVFPPSSASFADKSDMLRVKFNWLFNGPLMMR